MCILKKLHPHVKNSQKTGMLNEGLSSRPAEHGVSGSTLKLTLAYLCNLYNLRETAQKRLIIPTVMYVFAVFL
jgi:hypothetical protein